jgi:8-oxo-dGTP pyrophosphatase MutT (NUDIX family)
MNDVVIAYCVNELGEVLIARRPKEPFKDFYECPGGKRELHESLLEALHRELKEELGTTISKAHYIFHYDVFNDHGEFRMHWFKVLLTNTVHSDFYSIVKWVHPDHLLDYPWIKHNLPYMTDIQAACQKEAQSYTVSSQKELDDCLMHPSLKEKIHLNFDGFLEELTLLQYEGILTKI